MLGLHLPSAEYGILPILILNADEWHALGEHIGCGIAHTRSPWIAWHVRHHKLGLRQPEIQRTPANIDFGPSGGSEIQSCCQCAPLQTRLFSKWAWAPWKVNPPIGSGVGAEHGKTTDFPKVIERTDLLFP